MITMMIIMITMMITMITVMITMITVMITMITVMITVITMITMMITNLPFITRGHVGPFIKPFPPSHFHPYSIRHDSGNSSSSRN